MPRRDEARFVTRRGDVMKVETLWVCLQVIELSVGGPYYTT